MAMEVKEAERNCASMMRGPVHTSVERAECGGDRAYELAEQRCENGRIQKVKHLKASSLKRWHVRNAAALKRLRGMRNGSN